MYHTRTFIFFRSILRKLQLHRLKSLLLRSKSYEAAFERSMYASIQSSETFWDIGANHGVYTAKFLAGVNSKNVICFEPNPVLVSILKKRFQRESKIVVVEQAVSNFSGTIGFKFGEDELSATSQLCNDDTGDTLVSVLSLTDAIKKYNKPDLIKIDVEGAEVEILKELEDCIELLRGTILFIEIHFSIIEKNKKTKEIFESMKSLKHMSESFTWVDSSHVKLKV